MIIDKWLMFHPGKTAGTSIEQALLKRYGYKQHHELDTKKADYSMMYGIDRNSGVWLQHADMVYIHNHTTINVRDYSSFCFVRDPLTRLLSAYYYNSQDEKNDSLSLFVQKRLPVLFAKNKEYTKNHFGLQLPFVTHNDEVVDYIGRYENLADDLAAIGLPQLEDYKSAKTVASTKHKNYKDAFSLRDKTTVYQLFKDDYDFFEYDKPY